MMTPSPASLQTRSPSTWSEYRRNPPPRLVVRTASFSAGGALTSPAVTANRRRSSTRCLPATSFGIASWSPWTGSSARNPAPTARTGTRASARCKVSRGNLSSPLATNASRRALATSPLIATSGNRSCANRTSSAAASREIRSFAAAMPRCIAAATFPPALTLASFHREAFVIERDCQPLCSLLGIARVTGVVSMPIFGEASEAEVTRAILAGFTKDLGEYASTEVIIVGGGPSGLVAARELALNGVKNVVIERNNYIGGGFWIGGGPLETARPLGPPRQKHPTDVSHPHKQYRQPHRPPPP